MAWLFRGVLPILLGAILVEGGLVGGGLGLAYADTSAAPAGVSQCSTGSLSDFTHALAAAAAGSLNHPASPAGV